MRNHQGHKKPLFRKQSLEAALLGSITFQLGDGFALQCIKIVQQLKMYIRRSIFQTMVFDGFCMQAGRVECLSTTDSLNNNWTCLLYWKHLETWFVAGAMFTIAGTAQNMTMFVAFRIWLWKWAKVDSARQRIQRPNEALYNYCTHIGEVLQRQWKQHNSSKKHCLCDACDSDRTEVTEKELERGL